MRFLIPVLASVFIGLGSAGAQEASLPRGEAMRAWPAADYDPLIPPLERIVGHGFGEEITGHRDALAYLRALEAAAPDRVRVQSIGRSWQGRELVLAIITSPANMARLEVIQESMQRLGDPRITSSAEAERLIADLPAPVWLAYSVHGDEISPTDAALYTAYHLLAARGDERTARMLEETIVIINPLQNPDGRERFIASTLSARGLAPSDDPYSAERDQPWPGGRVNHYLFDLNRDWFAQAQPETRAHTRAMLDWLPVVVADIHEMDTDATYFFPPAAPPTNPYQTPVQMQLREMVGRTMASWFDRFGIDYYTREVFDLFYPGYGDGWPSYFGAAAMTYEQGSVRGLVARRSNGERLVFADTVWNQSVSSLATIETVASDRLTWLRAFYAYHQSAIASGREAEGGRYVLLPTQPQQAAADRLARLLASQRVEVSLAGSAFSACGARYSEGSYVIDLAQPASRFARVLLDRHVPIEEDFMAEQERLRALGLPDEIYDITAWSLPLMHNVTVNRCRTATQEGLTRLDPHAEVRGRVTNVTARTAFIVPWGDRNAIRFLTGALANGLGVRSAEEGFEVGGQAFPGGSLVVPVAGNPPDLSARLQALAEATGVIVTGVDDSWVTRGPNFGSFRTPHLRRPRIALVWDQPTNPNGAGSARFVLEQRFGAAVTPVRGESLGAGDLTRFDVIILPDGGGYEDVLGAGLAQPLSNWVSRGGVLIALGGAVRYLANPEMGLSDLRLEDAAREAPAENVSEREGGDADDPTVTGTRIEDEEAYRAMIAPQDPPPDHIAGALVEAIVEPDHWLTAGAAERVYVLYQGDAIYAPLRQEQGVNLVRYANPETVAASGAIWPENQAQLAFKPFMTVQEQGEGRIIAFTADPTTRALMEGLEILFANAVFRAPARSPVD